MNKYYYKFNGNQKDVKLNSISTSQSKNPWQAVTQEEHRVTSIRIAQNKKINKQKL